MFGPDLLVDFGEPGSEMVSQLPWRSGAREGFNGRGRILPGEDAGRICWGEEEKGEDRWNTNGRGIPIL